MSDKWHEMLDHLVNKNEDQAKEAFKSIIDNEKESFVAQDAVEPEVAESLSPADEKAVKDVVKGLKKAVSLHSKQATSLEKLLKAGKDKSLKTKEDPKDSKDSNNLSYFLSKKSLNDCLPPSYRQVPSVL